MGQNLVDDALCGRRAAGAISGMAASGGPIRRRGARFAAQSAPPDAGQSALIPTLTHVFVLADEINLFNEKLVRRVLVSNKMADRSGSTAAGLSRYFQPRKVRLSNDGPDAVLSIGRHAMSMKPSPFISSSSLPFGARRFTGEPFWIDVAKARMAVQASKKRMRSWLI